MLDTKLALRAVHSSLLYAAVQRRTSGVLHAVQIARALHSGLAASRRRTRARMQIH